MTSAIQAAEIRTRCKRRDDAYVKGIKDQQSLSKKMTFEQKLGMEGRQGNRVAVEEWARGKAKKPRGVGCRKSPSKTLQTLAGASTSLLTSWEPTMGFKQRNTPLSPHWPLQPIFARPPPHLKNVKKPSQAVTIPPTSPPVTIIYSSGPFP